MTSPTTRGARPRRSRPSTLVAGVVGALAAVGLGLAVTDVSAPTGHPDGVARVGGTVSTSYGRMWVSEVQSTDGVSHEDMGMAMPSGSDMGVADLVQAGEAALTVSVVLQNTSDHAVDPGVDRFTLLRSTAEGTTQSMDPERASRDTRALPAHSSIEVRVTFVVPGGSAPVRLSYRDPQRGSDLVLDLGRVGAPSTQAPGSHHH